MKGNTSVDAFLSLRDQVVALESQLADLRNHAGLLKHSFGSCPTCGCAELVFYDPAAIIDGIQQPQFECKSCGFLWTDAGGERIRELESKLAEKDEEIERLKRRLEIDTCRDGDGNLVPAPANMPDGIAARDYTIRQQQEEIRRLREALSKVLFQFDGCINYLEDEMEGDVVEDLRSLQKEAQNTLDGVPK